MCPSQIHPNDWNLYTGTVRVGGIQIILKVISLNNVFLSGTNRQACGKGDPTGQ